MMKDVIETTKEAYNKMAKEWSDKYFPSTKVENKIDKFVNYITTGKKILDVGCGPGRDTKSLMNRGFDVIGIDFSEEMVREAKSRVPSGDFRLMDMRKLDFDKNSFDGVWAFASLLHIPKEQAPKVLTEFRRVLKKSGVLAISMKQGKGEVLESEEETTRLFSYYTKDELVSLIEKSGFKILESFVEVLNNTWIVVLAEVIK